MRFGCCLPIDQAQLLKDVGFDYLECTVVSLLPEQQGEEVEQILEKYRKSPLPIEAFNVFLPKELTIVGENVDVDRIKRYLRNAFSRVAAVGGNTVVFGSGRSRNVPDGFPREKGYTQIRSFLNWAADEAEANGVTIAIEPLNTKESNILTSVAEAVEVARQVDRRSVKVLADFYHVQEENEPLANIGDAGSLLAHVHLADSGRRAPGTGQYPYAQFASELKRAGYDGRLSIECRWEDPEKETAQALSFLKTVF